MKKIILLFMACFPVILLIGAEYPRPYVGSSGPPTKGEMYDSLAAQRNRTRLDSIRMNDSLAVYRARVDSSFFWSVQDTFPTPNRSGTGEWKWGIAGDTTSPGFVYARDTIPNRWIRADTSVLVTGLAMAMDSVFKGAPCRFLTSGTFRNDAWNWASTVKALFSDSAIAGKINTGGQNNHKKMQYYGYPLGPFVVDFKPDRRIAYYVP